MRIIEELIEIWLNEVCDKYKFIKQANNTEFTVTMALFDETMFPKYLKAEQRIYTYISENYTWDNSEKDKIQQISSKDDNLLYSPSKKNNKKGKENNCDNNEDDTNAPEAYEEPSDPYQPTCI